MTLNLKKLRINLSFSLTKKILLKTITFKTSTLKFYSSMNSAASRNTKVKKLENVNLAIRIITLSMDLSRSNALLNLVEIL